MNDYIFDPLAPRLYERKLRLWGWRPRPNMLGTLTDLDADELTDSDKAVLDFERDHPARDFGKEADIREVFACSATLYYSRLLRIIEHPAAWPYDPQTVTRCTRLRDRDTARRDQRYRDRGAAS